MKPPSPPPQCTGLAARASGWSWAGGKMGMWWLRLGLYDLPAKNTLFTQDHCQENSGLGRGERKKKSCFERGGGGGRVCDRKSEFVTEGECWSARNFMIESLSDFSVKTKSLSWWNLAMLIKTFYICWCCKQGRFVMVGWLTDRPTDTQTGNYREAHFWAFHANTHKFHAHTHINSHTWNTFWNIGLFHALQPGSTTLSKAVKGEGGLMRKRANGEKGRWRSPRVST